MWLAYMKPCVCLSVCHYTHFFIRINKSIFSTRIKAPRNKLVQMVSPTTLMTVYSQSESPEDMLYQYFHSLIDAYYTLHMPVP